ncbi:MAG TPA: hypothetical protein VFK44_06360 [Bacillales bacterium]|nr:hypothetical protein [Bacillales bacterium]
MELHQAFKEGEYEELNTLYSDEEFQGQLYIPRVGHVQSFNVQEIREGNREAATNFKGKNIHFVFSGLQIVPQHENQAAVSYVVTYRDNTRMVRALNLEVWKKGPDHQWKMIRWYQEKGSNE